MKRDENTDEETTSSEEEDGPTPRAEKRVRFLFSREQDETPTKAEETVRTSSPEQSPRPKFVDFSSTESSSSSLTSIFSATTPKSDAFKKTRIVKPEIRIPSKQQLKGDESLDDVASTSSIKRVPSTIFKAGTSQLGVIRESSESESEKSFDNDVAVPKFVEKRVRILDPKEEEAEGLESKYLSQTSDIVQEIISIGALNSPNVSSTEQLSRRQELEDGKSEKHNVMFSDTVEDTEKDLTTTSGKQALYSKFVDKGTHIMKDSRKSFYEASQSEASLNVDNDLDPSREHNVDDFTHGYSENTRYIIPPMTEHEIRRLGGNKFLNQTLNASTEGSCKDHITLSLTYMTVNSKRDLKEIFHHISQNLQSIGKVYSARMLGRYHEFDKLFKFSGGNEGIVASMRFTSHCSDIIKSYIQLAALIEDPDGFTDIIMDLAKRHIKLGLTLRDHQVHYRPFIEIVASSSEDRMQIYTKTYFLVCLVSRAMMLAEQKIRKTDPDENNAPMPSRMIKTTKTKLELSTKQPIWE